MLLGFLEGFGLGVSEEEGERGRFDIGLLVGGGGVGILVEKLLVGAKEGGISDFVSQKSSRRSWS